MTRIDRYILVLFLRTVLVCYLSLSGIFIVFHAFTALDDLIAQTSQGDSLPIVLAKFYGPYLLLLFDMTGAVITLMAFLFTAGWLRRTGELTATLSAGVSHGRLLRPMVIATFVIITLQLFSREMFIPRFRDSLDMKAKQLAGEIEQPVSPTYDQITGVLIEGETLTMATGTIEQPNLRLYADYGEVGDLILAEEAVWIDPDDPATLQADPLARSWNPPRAGYLVRGVTRPESIDSFPSQSVLGAQTLLTANDTDWLDAGECFLITTVDPVMLQTNETGTRMASVVELGTRLRNPAVESSLALRVFLHERIVRAPLDFALVMLVLPLVVNVRGRKLFVLIGMAFWIVLGFFVLKTLAGTLGSNGIWVGPAVAAWIPLLVIGPIAYVRLRQVQTV